MTLLTRLQKLEVAGPRRTVCVWCEPGQTEEQAKAQWQAENPGEDLDSPSVELLLFRWLDPT